MTVYLDQVMILNFLVDFLLILGTNRLAGFPPGWKQALPAALLGAVYSGACMLPAMAFLGSALWRLVCLALMGFLAFGADRSALKRTGIFVLLAMAMGGVALGFGRENFGMLILSAWVVWLLCRVAFGGSVGGREYETVTITEAGRSATVVALRDSGNTLRDPITGESVMIVGPETAEKLTGLTDAELRDPMQTLLTHPGQGFRLIPYSSLGQSGSLLLSRRFSDVRTGTGHRSAVVAFAPDRIGTGEIYQALTGGV